MRLCVSGLVEFGFDRYIYQGLIAHLALLQHVPVDGNTLCAMTAKREDALNKCSCAQVVFVD